MATDSPLHPFGEPITGGELIQSPMVQHWLIYEVSRNAERYWWWLPIDLSGRGILEDRRVFGKPFGGLLPESEWPDTSEPKAPPSQRASLAWTFRLVAQYDAPVVVDL